MKKLYKGMLWGLILVIPFWLWVGTSFGATYYVDSSCGTPGNGTTLTCNGDADDAWDYIANVNGSSFNPGDSILFKRGETWREQLVVPSNGSDGNPIVFGSYGTGNLPLLLGSVEKNDSTIWLDEGSNIWRASGGVTTTGGELLSNPSFDVDTTGWNLYDNADVAESRDTVVYDSAPASYKIVCVDGGTRRTDVQLYSTVSFSIVSGDYYKLTFKAKSTIAFEMAAEGKGVAILKNGAPYGLYYSQRIGGSPSITTDWKTFEVYFEANATAADARVNFYFGGSLPDGATFNIDTLSFKACEQKVIFDLDVDVGNLIFNSEESVGIKVWNEADLDSQGEFWYDENNLIFKMYSTSNPASFYSDIECALRKDIISQAGRSYVTYEYLDLRYGGACGINGATTDNVIARYCDFSYIGGGDQSGGEATTRYGNAIQFWNNAHDNLVEYCRFWEIYDAPLTNQGTANSSTQADITYAHNLIWNSCEPFEIWLQGTDSTMSNVNVYNNTVYKTGYGWGYSQRADPQKCRTVRIGTSTGQPGVEIKNNIFSIGKKELLSVSVSTNTTNVVVDNNCYYKDSGDDMVDWKGDGYSISQFSNYQAAESQDLNSIAEDPLLTDPPEDFSLTGASPCRYAGEILASPYDQSIKPGSTWPDGVELIYSRHPIGAYDFPTGPIIIH